MQTILVCCLLVGLVIEVTLLYFSITSQDYEKAGNYMVVTAALGLYLLGYLLEVLSGSIETAKLSLIVENAGIHLIAPFFLFTIMGLYQPRHLKPWMMPSGLAYAFLMFLCVLSNDFHHLYYTSMRMVFDGSSYFLSLGRGPLYAVHQIVSGFAVIMAYVVIFSRYFTGTLKTRRQMRLIACGSLLAFAANVLNFLEALPAWLDLTPFAIALALALASIDLFRYKLLDIVPIASNTALETMEDAMIVLDGDWCFKYCNKSAKQLFPGLGFFSSTELVTQVEGWPEALMPGTAPGQISFECQNESGDIRHYRASLSRISDGRGGQIGWSLVIRNVTDLATLMRQLEALATTDPLTGIYNRRQFMAMVNREFEIATRHSLNMSLILFDIDFFKKVNDTHGHIVGDSVLCAVVDTIKKQLRSYDIFARYGGEEFVIFTTTKDDTNLEAFATRLCRSIMQANIVCEGVSIPITASFGAVQVVNGSNFNDMMLAADNAMYQAKTMGRNRVVLVKSEE